MNVGKFLRKIRIERGLSLREVASAVGIAHSSLCEYEKGLTDPSTSKFLKLCDFYNVSLIRLNEDDVESVVYADFTEESRKKIKAITKYEIRLKLNNE